MVGRGLSALSWCLVFGSVFLGGCAVKVVDFRVDDYYRSVQKLRDSVRCDAVTRSRPKEHASFPRLCDAKSLKSDDKFVQVKFDLGQNKVVTFAVYAANLYVLGFKSKTTAYLLDEAPEFGLPTTFFAGATARKTIGSGRYVKLAQASNKTPKEKIQLGIEPLRTAVRQLADNPEDTAVRARSLIVCIQALSEAARFGHIEERIAFKLDYPDAKTNYLEINWSKISEAVQAANPQTGALKSTYTVDYTQEQLKTVGDIVDKLGNIKMLLKA
ncbi:unnamed protein product [Bemisia tabaci]|uniref:Uncharacterized protein n=2 Tax=Bemisia tabaci TaxID=7038 RepID=A0A9P0AC36_BEMTA|nr:unnamed protein product [Bemisia tabaci]